MDSVHQAGVKKKSFELNFNGGTIWCEHLLLTWMKRLSLNVL